MNLRKILLSTALCSTVTTLSASAELLESQLSNTDKHSEQHEHQASFESASKHYHQDKKDTHKHSDSTHNESHDDELSIKLTPQQIALANIKVQTIKAKPVRFARYAPGELQTNGYTSFMVSPRVASIVIRRHVSLGNHVKTGQPLVTLFSESIAQAQGEYRVAYSEWNRLKKLSKNLLEDKRRIEAQVALESSLGKLKAFGLNDKAIKTLQTRQAVALGEYTLYAETEGVVLRDKFHQGQRVEAGEPLFELADESQLWVEARLSVNERLNLTPDTKVYIQVQGQKYSAQLAQEAHTIDPVTRTRVIRLILSNNEHLLHPGMFVDVFFESITKNPTMALPETALVRGSDGNWMIYVEEEPGHFSAKEIKLGRTFGNMKEVTGIPSSSRVVVEGAFFVASELQKNNFDPHNH